MREPHFAHDPVLLDTVRRDLIGKACHLLRDLLMQDGSRIGLTVILSSLEIIESPKENSGSSLPNNVTTSPVCSTKEQLTQFITHHTHNDAQTAKSKKKQKICDDVRLGQQSSRFMWTFIWVCISASLKEHGHQPVLAHPPRYP